MHSREIWQSRKAFGIVNTFHDLAIRALNRVLLLKVLMAVKIEGNDLWSDAHDGRYRFDFLDNRTVRELATHSEYQISDDFLTEALSNSDQCYGIFDGRVLASYGWCSEKPTRIDPPTLRLNFSNEYAYVYKLFTHPDYRGRRLVAIGLSRALHAYLRRGFQGLVAVVESNNFSSRKAMRRVGFQDVGKIYLGKLFGCYIVYSDQGCIQHRFELKPADPTGTGVSQTRTSPVMFANRPRGRNIYEPSTKAGGAR